jgi:hypothetical protein
LAPPYLQLEDTIVIPVKLSETWTLYWTQKSILEQAVFKVVANYKRIEKANKYSPGAILSIDLIMYTLGERCHDPMAENGSRELTRNRP